MSQLLDTVLLLVLVVFGLAIPTVCGVMIGLRHADDERRRLRRHLGDVRAERDGALRALAVIGQVQTNPPRTAGLAPVAPETLATSPVRVLRRLSAVVDSDDHSRGGPVSAGRPVVIGGVDEADGSR